MARLGDFTSSPYGPIELAVQNYCWGLKLQPGQGIRNPGIYHLYAHPGKGCCRTLMLCVCLCACARWGEGALSCVEVWEFRGFS